ncbi:phosphomannomutase/phosphoglucomutase [Candidatus Gracilibacteria bacterium]|nr:phosphomannomutase/phosphoglucomutase [Candidatus Gracilibacteria bacterium]
MVLDPKIFRAYDIRGEAFKDFDEDGFFVVSQSFCKYVAKQLNVLNPKIFVSGDGRLSMPELYPAVLAGVEAGGGTVTWGGAIPTPINYFALHEGGFDGAIQISASHNPPEYNGVKFVSRKGVVAGEQIQEIRKLAECEECRGGMNLGECTARCQEVEYSPAYTKKISKITSPQKPKKIVIDCGNAIPGAFYPDILRSFGHKIVDLFCDVDTSFPNHQPDPERKENLASLIDKVKEEQSDFGFAFDGDGDRLGIVLEDGTILNADKILYILAADFLSRNPNSPVVVDAMTSSILIEKIKDLGGIPVMSKTGHSYIEKKMKESGSLLGGEQSGHFMIGENFYGHDDALLAALRFLSAIENNSSLLLEVTTKWPSLLEFSEKFTVPDEKKFKVLEKISLELQQKFPEASLLDGVRLNFGQGEWGIIRCSNTSPKISIRIEAKDQQSLDGKKQLLISVLQNAISQKLL